MRLIRDGHFKVIRASLTTFFRTIFLPLFLCGCMPYGESLNNQHKDLGLETRWPLPDQNFDAYMNKWHGRIRDARASAGLPPLSEEVVVNRSPFRFVGSGCKESPPEKGILLVHGLLDSSYVMRDLGEALTKKCLLIQSINLDGHGTIPADLLHTDYMQWVTNFVAGVDSFPPFIKEIIPLGYSTGATLALFHAQRAQSSSRVKGLILLAPGVQAVDHELKWASLHRSYSWLISKGAWSSLHSDNDLYKYESLPKNAAYQFHLLSKSVRENQAVLKMPIMMIGSADDGTVEINTAAQFICDRGESKSNTIIIYRAKKESEAEYSSHCNVISFRDSLKFNVYDFSHLTLPVKPSNAYYGEKQNYINCLHYQGEDDKYRKCIDDDFVFGESSPTNLKLHIIRRLTFNPDFDQTVEDILNFTQSTFTQ